MGILAAKYKNTIIDFLLMSLATVGMSLPGFCLGLIVIMLFSVKLGWFPIAGGTGLIDERAKALLTDIGTEELGHLEVIATLVYKLIKGAKPKEMREAGLGAHYADHDKTLFYSDANGVPWTAAYIQTKGDPVADLADDIGLINITDDPDLIQVLKYLREREIVHSQRFREALFLMESERDAKKIY